jgi:hypothetical protein
MGNGESGRSGLLDDDGGQSRSNRTDNLHRRKWIKEMKLGTLGKTHAFTVVEMMFATAAASAIVAVTLTSSVALQKTFNQIDNYSATQMQQIRIVDYLARDVKRGLSVTSSLDLQTVTISIPRYIVQAGDPEASNPSLIGTSRLPIRTYASPTPGATPSALNSETRINYWPSASGTPFPSGSPTSNVVYCISNSAGTDCNTSGNPAGKAILRKQDGIVTTIASSTDNLLPATTDIELANTEYTSTAVTFQPISVADRTSTTVYSTAYLRNRRR